MSEVRVPRGFPIQGEVRMALTGVAERVGGFSIPWSVAEVAYRSYRDKWGRGNQSLERLAQRGGFGRDELLELLAHAADKGMEATDD